MRSASPHPHRRRPWVAAAALAGALLAAPAAAITVTTGRTAAVPAATLPAPVALASERVVPLSSRVLAVSVDPTMALAGLDGSRFRLQRSGVDGGDRPLAVGARVEPARLLGDWTAVRVAPDREWFLCFAQDLVPGTEYILEETGLPGWRTRFRYEPGGAPNGSVKTNHLGYLPGAPKYGYVGNYLGTAGPLDVQPDGFQVVDAATGRVALTGLPVLRGDDPALSGERVYECDFSSLRYPGRYYLNVPGVGRGHDFRIAADVYADAFRVTARALFYQRCGLDLAAPVAGPTWSRAACHLEDGVIHPSQGDSPLYGGETVGARVDAVGGWHDAGDYGKYVPTAAVTLHYLLTAYELYPERLASDGLGLPESGNGVPDVLDEARWEVAWLRRMQAPDGGVYHKLTTLAWPTTMPADDGLRRDLAPKTTHATAVAAAALAAAGRVFRPFWPEYADSCLTRARRAWQFLEAHPEAVPALGFHNPPGIGGGEYGDPEGDVDDRAWAAAELYKTTGDAAFERAFARLWPQHPPAWGWNPFQHHQQKASFAYATTPRPTRRAFVEAYRRALAVQAEDLERHTAANPYRGAYRGDVPEWIGWGALAQSPRYAWDLLLAEYLLYEPRYAGIAAVNVGLQLGANPQDRTYITGLGYNAPRDPLHHPSLHDGTPDPVPGLPVFGPHAELSGGNPFFEAARHAFAPAGVSWGDPYPVLRRWVDLHELVPMNEFTILDIGQAAAVYGILTEADLPRRREGDFDGDGDLGLGDFHRLVAALGGADPRYDLTRDGWVDLDDAFTFADRLSAAASPAAARVAGLLGRAPPGRTATPGDLPELGPSYPNPFNGDTRIPYLLPSPGPMRLTVHNITGQRLRTLIDDDLEAGAGTVTWDGTDESGIRLATGIYLLRLVARGRLLTRPVLLLE